MILPENITKLLMSTIKEDIILAMHYIVRNYTEREIKQYFKRKKKIKYEETPMFFVIGDTVVDVIGSEIYSFSVTENSSLLIAFKHQQVEL